MITGSESKGIECIQQVPNSSFQMKDLGKLNYFLGLLEAYVTPSGIYSIKQEYLVDFLDHAPLSAAHSIGTLMEVNLKVHKRNRNLFLIILLVYYGSLL